MAVLAIEGLSFSGKTTLLKALEADDVSIVPEIGEAYAEGRDFPAKASSTSQWQRDMWFLDREIERFSLVRGNVIMDRCVLSFAAHLGARRVLNGTWPDHRVMRRLNEALKSHALGVPHVVILDVPMQEILRRRTLRFSIEGPIAVLQEEQSPTFLESLRQRYKIFLNSIGDAYATSVAGTNSVDALCAAVRSRLEESEPCIVKADVAVAALEATIYE